MSYLPYILTRTAKDFRPDLNEEPHLFPPSPCKTIKLTPEIVRLDELNRRALEARNRPTWKAKTLQPPAFPVIAQKERSFSRNGGRRNG